MKIAAIRWQSSRLWRATGARNVNRHLRQDLALAYLLLNGLRQNLHQRRRYSWWAGRSDSWGS
ncbi:MAG TPA: hypothetical protein VII41_08665, partial [Steroidobacteraceae bacterium]